MSGLKEDLAELSSTLPSLPPLVAALQQQAEALGTAASALLGDAAATRAEIEAALTRARAAIPELEADAQALAGRLDASMDAAEESWASAREGLDTAADTIETAADGADLARQDLQGAMTQMAVRVDEAASGREVAMRSLERMAPKERERLETISGVLAERTEELFALLDRSRDALAAAVADLGDHLVRLTERVSVDSAFLVGEVCLRLVSDHGSQLQQIDAAATADASALSERTMSRVQNEVNAAVALAAAEPAAALETLATDMAERAATMGEQRKELGASLAHLMTTASPVPAVLREVEEAARQVDDR